MKINFTKNLMKNFDFVLYYVVPIFEEYVHLSPISTFFINVKSSKSLKKISELLVISNG